MHAKGHLGLALLVLSIISIPFGLGPDNIVLIVIVFTTGLSTIPDIDLQLEIKHRGFTHNILFALICGIGFGAVLGYSSGLIWGIIGFIAGFGGVLLHLLGDIMTHIEFAPLSPFKRNEIALHWFYADSEIANNGFFTLGIIAFFGYILISSGALESFI